MLRTKRLLSYWLCISLLALTGCLTSCYRETEKNTIRIGTISGPETELMQTVKQVAAKQGLNLVIVEFSDYNMPNTALQEGSIDANMFQHLPYLEQTNKAKHYDLVEIGKTFIYPMGLYSKKWRKLSDLPNDSLVAIPNDPSNEARALLLLEHARLLVLRRGVTAHATISDIAENPKKLVFKSLDAAQLPRALPDVALAAINTNYAIPAGLIPTKDALIVEGTDSLYANLLVIRADKDSPNLRKLVKILHSPAIAEKATQIFHSQAIPAWK